MLKLNIDNIDLYNEKENKFTKYESKILCFEHSLFAISLWESKYKKSFFSSKKTQEEILDYFRLMIIDEKDREETSLDYLKNISPIYIDKINKYMNDPMTATTINDDKVKLPNNGSFTTSELIYYWMSQLAIPFECDKWNFNRLYTLIKIASIKNAPAKKMKKDDIMSRYSKLNASRMKNKASKNH